MEQVIDFTIGFSENVAWPWPIAVYLFLAGISGGAFAAAALVRIFRKQTQITPLFQAASFIALVTILLGMICLVFDLTKPLDFWKILIFYNPTSVMSVGVMALLVFIPTMFLVTLVSFYEFAQNPAGTHLDRSGVCAYRLRLHRLSDQCPGAFPAHQHGCSSGAFCGFGTVRGHCL